MSIYVITFESTHAAMAAGKALQQSGLSYQTIPVPSAISAGCGIAQRFETDDPASVLSVIFGDNPDYSLSALYQQLPDKNYELVPCSEV